jgi:hypothetical protein
MRYRKVGARKRAWNPDDMERALMDIRENKISLRKAARQYGLKRATLQRRMKLLAAAGDVPPNAPFPYHRSSMKVFTEREEGQLVEYCLAAAKMGFGISPVKLKKLAYEYAVRLNKRLPHSRRQAQSPWELKQQAGDDWFTAFMKKHRELSIRKPEATSIGRMSAFNRHTVGVFYDNLRSVLTKYNFEPRNIWNCDETGITTVQVPEHVIAHRGERQVGSVTSAERGTLVTMCNAVSAAGSCVPPFYVFPRVNYRDIFLKNCYPGSKGVAQVTGWMTEVCFRDWLEHFMNVVKPTEDEPVLLILDNHETHLSIDVIDAAKERGVILVTIPPHTSHKLQPLDVSVYSPFKRLYNRELDSWLVSHPAKTLTIYELAELSGKAWAASATPANIISGFESAGIHPFRPDKWQDTDFCLAQVTDRPMPNPNETSAHANGGASTSSGVQNDSNITSDSGPSGDAGPIAGPTADAGTPSNRPTASSTPDRSFVIPEIIRPLPKAAPRQSKQGMG